MKRNINADLLKCISIFGVVFIHSAFILEDSSILIYLSDIFRISVPSFILVWAYFFEKSLSKKPTDERKEYLLKRFIHLFRVFLIWSLLYFFIEVDWGQLTIKDLFTKYFSGYGWSGQYFFIILFQLLILFPIIKKIYDVKLMRILTLICVLAIYIIWNYFFESIPLTIKKLGQRPFIFWLPYVFLGIALANNHIKTIPFFFIYAPIFIAIEFYCMMKINLTYFEYITLGVLFSSILFCTSILQADPIRVPKKLNNIIFFIGGNTLIIFVSNPLIIILLQKGLDLWSLDDFLINLPAYTKTILSMAIVIIVFSGSLAVAKLLEITNLKNKLA
ncbi:acyltransferase family protein [Zobellia laminariae]|uniref:acyltransferase family protein n=1 Tax=Zobellia laminariae TaxID=248906 RepID=UPI0026F46575|nr:acyltransferase [Zobellia laminariae]WKX77479.1 acyltransferase [Zobellia laminariae]